MSGTTLITQRRRLESLKKQQGEIEKTLAAQEAVKATLLTRLENEFSCSSLGAAQGRLRSLNEKIEELSPKVETMLLDLEKKLETA